MQENSYTKTWLTSGAIKTLGLEFGEIRYCDVGEGPLLLLIHTLRTQLDYFQELIPLLTNRYRVIAIDLPGHGHSSIPLDARFDEPYFRQSVKDFIQALDLRQLTIVGESIGGVLALTIAGSLPDLISRVISLNPYDYGEKFGGGIRRSKYGSIIALFGAFESWTIEPSLVLRFVLSGGFYDESNLPAPLFQEFVRVGKRKGYRQAEYLLYKHWRSWLDARSLYKSVEAPIILTYGEDDWSQPEEREERRISLSPERYVIFEKSGHFSALEMPEQLANVI